MLVEQAEAILNKYQTDLPALLLAAGLLNYEEYNAFFIEDDTKRIFVVYTHEAGDSEDVEEGTFLIDSQLPGIIDIQDYSSVLWKYTKTLNHRSFGYFGYTTLEKKIVNNYPEGFGDGGAGGGNMIQLKFKGDKDSCD